MAPRSTCSSRTRWCSASPTTATTTRPHTVSGSRFNDHDCVLLYDLLALQPALHGVFWLYALHWSLTPVLLLCRTPVHGILFEEPYNYNDGPVGTVMGVMEDGTERPPYNYTWIASPAGTTWYHGKLRAPQNPLLMANMIYDKLECQSDRPLLHGADGWQPRQHYHPQAPLHRSLRVSSLNFDCEVQMLLLR